MKTSEFLFIFIILLGLGLTSCSTTTETTTDNTVQVQQMQMAQQNIQEHGERSGLTADVIQKLNDYAKNKAHLACKMEGLDKTASQALSDVAEDEMKESIVALDDRLTTLNLEIESYCNTEDRRNFFHRAYNQYYLACKDRN